MTIARLEEFKFLKIPSRPILSQSMKIQIDNRQQQQKYLELYDYIQLKISRKNMLFEKPETL